MDPVSRLATPSYLDLRAAAFKPTALLAESYPRSNFGPFTTTNALTTQRMNMQAIYLTAGMVVTNVGFDIGGVAANTPTNSWVALYTSARVLLAQSADQGTAAIPADTAYSLALSAAQTITTSGLY